MLVRTPWKNPVWRGNRTEKFTAASAIASATALAWTLLTPLTGPWVSPATLWVVEPAAYIGGATTLLTAAMAMAGMERLRRAERDKQSENKQLERRWENLTEEFLRVFDHDLGRPMRRIYGKKRDVDAILKASGHEPIDAITELMDEIEQQVPNYRLMLQNVQALVNLEDPDASQIIVPTDAAYVVGKTVDRYMKVAQDAGKLVEWQEDAEGVHMVATNPNAVEHIVGNLADNAVKHAGHQIAITLETSDEEVRIQVADDGPGINQNHVDFIFERSWTPEAARREEKESSGLGLHIARTMARRYGGDVILTSAGGPAEDQRTVFTMTLPNLRQHSR